MFWAESLAVRCHDHDKILQPSKTHVRRDCPMIAEPFFLREYLLWRTKCFKYVINMFSFIQPLLFAASTEPIGAPLMNFWWYLTLANINNGGTVFPAALWWMPGLLNDPFLLI